VPIAIDVPEARPIAMDVPALVCEMAFKCPLAPQQYDLFPCPLSTRTHLSHVGEDPRLRAIASAREMSSASNEFHVTVNNRVGIEIRHTYIRGKA
jgi:hypothetical protein